MLKSYEEIKESLNKTDMDAWTKGRALVQASSSVAEFMDALEMWMTGALREKNENLLVADVQKPLHSYIKKHFETSNLTVALNSHIEEYCIGVKQMDGKMRVVKVLPFDPLDEVRDISRQAELDGLSDYDVRQVVREALIERDMPIKTKHLREGENLGDLEASGIKVDYERE